MKAASRVLPAMTEKDLTRAVKELADMFGWKRYHTHRSDFSPAGWPDEVLCRPPRLVIAELKGDKGKLSPAQQGWIVDLSACPGVEVYVWRPADLDDIARVLR